MKWMLFDSAMKYLISGLSLLMLSSIGGSLGGLQVVEATDSQESSVADSSQEFVRDSKIFKTVDEALQYGRDHFDYEKHQQFHVRWVKENEYAIDWEMKDASSEDETAETSQEELGNTESAYQVSEEELDNASFYLKGMNIPNRIDFNFKDGTVLLTRYDEAADKYINLSTYKMEVEDIPTETITVNLENTREVQVNTKIKIGDYQEGQLQDYGNVEYYAFYNKNGGISIATPNYAGNVEDAQSDIMLEYTEKQ